MAPAEARIVAPGPIPRPPRFLDERGRAFWRRFAPRLTWRGSTVFRYSALSACCSAYAHWMRAEQELRAKVLRIRPDEFKVLTKIRNDARRLCIRLARRLGLVGRRRIERTRGPERIH